MKLETVLPYAKIGIAVLAGVVGGGSATMAYKSADPKPQTCPQVTVTCKCDHPPIKGELIFKK